MGRISPARGGPAALDQSSAAVGRKAARGSRARLCIASLPARLHIPHLGVAELAMEELANEEMGKFAK